jgi:excinuclease UvrABC nuclease subunit
MRRPHLTDLPECPGVYLFHNTRGAVLYVGKALNLRRRIASYFHRRRQQPPKLRRMIARAAALTIHETGSELEALLLESRLIKQEAPPYNQLSTAYSSPPFVKLTLSEPFPRLLLTHEWTPDGSHYLGPFPHVEIAAVVWAALQRLFPLRTCEAAIQPGVFPQPCEALQLRKCAAPCLGAHAALAYPRHVDDLLTLLAQGRGAIVERLRQQRQRAADAMFFERAGHLHTLLAALDAATVGRPLALLPVALRNFVVLIEGALPHTHEIFCIRHGLFAGRFMNGERLVDEQALEAFLARSYAAADHPSQRREAVVDELRIVAGWLHRTRARASWVYLHPQMTSTAAGEAVVRALSASQIHAQ